MGLGALMRIQSLLSKHNVELLWVIMASLADPRHPAFHDFWKAYCVSRGGSVADVSQGAKLSEQLRDILREHLDGMK